MPWWSVPLDVDVIGAVPHYDTAQFLGFVNDRYDVAARQDDVSAQ